MRLVPRPHLARLAALLLVATAAAGRADPETAAEEARVAELDARRREAMVRDDRAALDPILAEDLTYTHSSGLVDSKAAFLALLASGALRYRMIDVSELRVRVLGSAAVVTGRQRMELLVSGSPVVAESRFTAVYADRGRGLELVAYQSTRLGDVP